MISPDKPAAELGFCNIWNRVNTRKNARFHLFIPVIDQIFDNNLIFTTVIGVVITVELELYIFIPFNAYTAPTVTT